MQSSESWMEERAMANDADGDAICANCGHEFDHHINPDLTARKCDAEIAALTDSTLLRISHSAIATDSR